MIYKRTITSERILQDYKVSSIGKNWNNQFFLILKKEISEGEWEEIMIRLDSNELNKLKNLIKDE